MSVLAVVDIEAGTARWETASSRSAHRMLTWNVPVPDGVLLRNECHAIYLTVEETVPWKGEPLRVFAQRRIDKGTVWGTFTDTAAASIRNTVSEAVQRAGFHTLWTRSQARQINVPELAANRVRAAADLLEWTRMLGELEEMIVAGAEFRPCQPTRISRGDYHLHAHKIRPQTVASAEILHDGDRVGWVTTTGEIVPTWEQPETQRTERQ